MEEDDQPTYQLALCELYHPLLHGTLNISNNIYNNFLIDTTYEPCEFFDNSYKLDETSLRRHRRRQSRALGLVDTHPTLRKYTQHYIRLEIVQYHILTLDGSRYHIAYIKTFWLRIVQRCWKKVYKARKDLIIKRSTIQALIEKERTGLWAKHLRTWPAFKLNLKQ